MAVLTGWAAYKADKMNLYQNDTLLMHKNTGGRSLLNNNRGGIPIAGGTSLVIESTQCTPTSETEYEYFIQGYYAQP